MKTYTEKFKKTIVELYETGNKTKSELARVHLGTVLFCEYYANYGELSLVTKVPQINNIVCRI